MSASASQIVLQALRADPSLAGKLIAERIEQAPPVAMVEEAGGPPRSSHTQPILFSADLQIDAWGSSKEEAWDLWNAIASRLLSAPRVDPDHSAGRLIRASVPHPTYEPDRDWLLDGRPAPRYSAIVTVTVKAT